MCQPRSARRDYAGRLWEMPAPSVTVTLLLVLPLASH